MPKMGGAELSKKILELKPDAKIMFMSGYTNDEISRDGVEAKAVNFLHKPFTPKKLLSELSKVFCKTSVKV